MDSIKGCLRGAEPLFSKNPPSPLRERGTQGVRVTINNKTTYIELEPELDACVETQAKRRYNQIVSELLNKGEEKELAEKLEILRLFLESADFNKLRSESERHLLEGRKV